MDIMEDELRRLRGDRSLEKKLCYSPLQDLMLSLVELLETDSEESQSLEREKGALSLTVAYEPISTSILVVESSSSSILPSTPPIFSTAIFPVIRYN